MEDPARPKYRLLTIGDVLVDEFLAVPQEDIDSQCRLDTREHLACFPYGEKIALRGVEYSVGGNAANNAVGMSRLGIKTALVATIGSDWTATMILDVLAAEGVGTCYVETARGQCGARGVVINYAGERTILSYHPKMSYKLPEPIPEVEWVYLTSMGEGYEETYGVIAARRKNAGGKLAFNPGTRQLKDGVEKWRNVLAVTDLLLVNREEAEVICNRNGNSNRENGHGDVKSLLGGLAGLGAKVVVITDGPNGAYAIDRGQCFYCTTYGVEVVERTGAGDAFGVGFMGAVMEGKETDEALKWGMVDSASVLTKVGAQAGLLRKEEMERWLVGAGGVKVERI